MCHIVETREGLHSWQGLLYLCKSFNCVPDTEPQGLQHTDIASRDAGERCSGAEGSPCGGQD